MLEPFLMEHDMDNEPKQYGEVVGYSYEDGPGGHGPVARAGRETRSRGFDQRTSGDRHNWFSGDVMSLLQGPGGHGGFKRLV